MVEITPFDARRTEIEGLLFLTMKHAQDERGVVREFYRESAIAEAALPPSRCSVLIVWGDHHLRDRQTRRQS